MDLHERLNAFIFPEAVSSGCFGDDVQKFVGFKTHEREGIINFCSQIIFGEVTLERQAGGRFSQSVVIKTQNRLVLSRAFFFSFFYIYKDATESYFPLKMFTRKLHCSVCMCVMH